MLRIDLVQHGLYDVRSGIGRYTSELYHALQAINSTLDPALQLSIQLTTSRLLPGSKQFHTLRHFPLGVNNRQPGSIVHLMQIMGAAQMLWRHHTPSMITVHDLGVLTGSADEGMHNAIDQKVLALQLAGLKRVDRVVTISEFTRKSVIDLLGVPADRVRRAYCGISPFTPVPQATARAELAKRYSLTIPEGHFWLTYVGSELPRKNLRVLLHSLRLLLDQGISVSLIKVGKAGGEQWEKQTNKSIAEYNLENVFQRVGVVPDDELPLFYGAADLFVTTSLLEGFGLPAIEAMKCGCPVVCSNAGSLPEVVGDAAYITDQNDAAAVASTIATVLTNPDLREQMRMRGFEQAKQFTWDRTAATMIDIYRELAASSARRIQAKDKAQVN